MHSPIVRMCIKIYKSQQRIHVEYASAVLSNKNNKFFIMIECNVDLPIHAYVRLYPCIILCIVSISEIQSQF